MGTLEGLFVTYFRAYYCFQFMKMRFPAIFVNHGGGPLPLMGKQDHLANHMRSAVDLLPSKPKAIVVLSAHWEANPIQISNYMAQNPVPLLYDYGGFPSETYQYQYPAVGNAELSHRIQGLLEKAGIPSKLESSRGFDHGVFVPLMLMYPKADIPVVAVSLSSSLDAATNMAIGRALAPLRENEEVLLLGSGYTFHNMSAIFHPTNQSRQASQDFNSWLEETLVSSSMTPSERYEKLLNWSKAPGARICHPREEHLLPLFMLASSNNCEQAQVIYSNENIVGSDHRVTGYLFN
jgi:4,5-DOPA dioxygenase extradiol